MDFRGAVRRMAVEISDDMDMEYNTMDPQVPSNPWGTATTPSTDEMDPASPGGPSPYNGSEPFGEPVVSNPEWLDPSQQADRRGHTVPYTPGPTQNVTTLHNARRAHYAAQETRNRR